MLEMILVDPAVKALQGRLARLAMPPADSAVQPRRNRVAADLTYVVTPHCGAP